MANDNFWLGVMIGNLFSKKGNNGEQKGGCLGKIIGILVIIGIGNLAIKYYGIKGILIPIAILIAAFALLVFLSIKLNYAKDTASFFLNLYNEGKYTQAIEYIEQEPKEKIEKVFKKYPDVARVDYQGRRHVFGQRHNFCPNSENYRRLAKDLVAKLAQRYSDNSHIVAWHINNEYGGNCYCENCQHAFQKWLQQKYQTLDQLNRAWNNNVWSHTIYHWDEIVVPNELGDAWGPEGTHTIVAGLSLDYLRFQSEALRDLYRMEKATIEEYDQKTPILTNFHSTPNKMIDYQS